MKILGLLFFGYTFSLSGALYFFYELSATKSKLTLLVEENKILSTKITSLETVLYKLESGVFNKLSLVESQINFVGAKGQVSTALLSNNTQILFLGLAAILVAVVPYGILFSGSNTDVITNNLEKMIEMQKNSDTIALQTLGDQLLESDMLLSSKLDLIVSAVIKAEEHAILSEHVTTAITTQTPHFVENVARAGFI